MLALHAIVEEDLKRIAAENISWKKLQNKTVLVTGAGGMIGFYLTAVLLYLNDMQDLQIQVIGVVRNREKAKQRFGILLQRKDFSLLVQDVAEPLQCDKKVDFILHAASQVTPKMFMCDPVGTLWTNICSTRRLLEMAREMQAVFLYLSTREIYGASVSEQEQIGEDGYGIVDPTLVRSCYPEGKRASETLIAAYRSQYGIDAKIVRIAHTYGPGLPLGDGRVLSDFLGDVVAGRDIVLKSRGEGILALTYLSDTVTGIYQVLLDFPEWLYNVAACDEPITVRALAEKLIELQKRRNLKIAYTVPPKKAGETGYLQNRVALLDASKAMRSGWVPKFDLTTSLRRFLMYYGMEK